jgi:dipeptidyl aminopeptidase/acylaminoacyl peptidase
MNGLYQPDRDKNMRQFVVDEIKTIAHDEDSISEVAWDYAGNRLAFVRSDGRIWIHDLSRAASYPLVEGRSPEWLPDNEKILFERDWVLYSCPVAEGSADRRVWDGHELGADVRLHRPRVSPKGVILIQCHHIKDSEHNRFTHFFAQASSEAGRFELLPLSCSRSDVVWDRKGENCLIEGWVGENETRIVGEDWQFQAVFRVTLGDFSPQAQKMAAFMFGINAIYLHERHDGEWQQVHSLPSPREIALRNRIHWLSDSILAFEAGSQLYLVEIETKETAQVDVDLSNLTRRGVPSISWQPTGSAFVFEAHEDDQVALTLVRLAEAG